VPRVNRSPRSMPEIRWVSISQYARLYGIDRRTVYKWLDAGLLTVYRVDRVVRIKALPPLPAMRRNPVKTS
jgi:excisionase family DNA binding protein